MEAIRFGMEHLWTAAVGAVLAAWLLATVLHQFRFAWWEQLARFDRLNLVPTWTFFAPNPGRHDFHLLYRDWERERPLEWRELVPEQVGWRWRWIWNPGRFPRKAVSDLTTGLHRAASQCAGNPAAVTISTPYLSLLQIIMAQPADLRSRTARQFALVASQGFGAQRRLEVKYLSWPHRVHG